MSEELRNFQKAIAEYTAKAAKHEKEQRAIWEEMEKARLELEAKLKAEERASRQAKQSEKKLPNVIIDGKELPYGKDIVLGEEPSKQTFEKTGVQWVDDYAQKLAKGCDHYGINYEWYSDLMVDFDEYYDYTHKDDDFTKWLDLSPILKSHSEALGIQPSELIAMQLLSKWDDSQSMDAIRESVHLAWILERRK